MNQYHVAVIVGSLRQGSFNQKVAEILPHLAPSDFVFKFVPINDLPLYNQDDDVNPSAPVLRFKGEIVTAHALIFVTPEYNRSIPGVLKNALDHGSRPHGRNSFAGKPTGVLGVSIGSNGSAMAQQHLRNILAYLDAPTMGQPEMFLHLKDTSFDSSGHINKDTRQFLQTWMDHYAVWVKKFVALA